ncbi:MAG: 30S ribosomal protein S2 [Candidatus Omnitrophica bacterium]|nr:30S ribosomal protein S2 [Candidatus Omnitrophota bacterium]
MIDEVIKKMLEAGVHFGHQTKRWNPKMKKYIFGQRSGIYIIDLEKTLECLNKAKDFARDIALKGGRILFVGTKKQAQMTVEQEANRVEMFYVKNRWSGGLLTNFQTVKGSIARLREIEKMKENGVWENLKKKEVARLTKESEKLIFNFGGILNMKDIPQAVFIVDPHKEQNAVRESKKLGIPVIAIIDTNGDPDAIDFPIPGNDDALKSISLIANLVTESVLEGRKEFKTTQTMKAKASQEDKPAA